MSVFNMIAKLTILSCLLAIAHSRYVGYDFQIPFLSTRIIGGHNAKEGEFPHQVSLQLGVPGMVEFQHFCGGSILSDRWILTAVHCLDAVDETLQQVPFAMFVVKAGKHDLSVTEDTEQLALVESYVKHKQYTSGDEPGPYDIGLIKLKTPLKLNKRITAVALPEKNSEPTGNVVLSGWGAITNDTKEPEYPIILQTITLPIVNRAECNAAIEKIAEEEGVKLKNPVHETNICTGPLTGGISACSGDSGGPLTAKRKDGKSEVVGIVSWGIVPCGRKGAPAVFVRISSFIDWIADIMAKH